MMSQSVLVDYPEPYIARITLNRPKALNALNVDLLENLVKALQENAGARVIILQGAGDRSFCAGEDLKQTLAPKTGSAEELRVSFQRLQDLTRLTSSASAIVVAAVHGFAIGGGAEIALAADFVIGGPGAKFRFPEATIGHAVTGGISLRLVQMVGLLRAKELFLCGRFVDAEESLRLGMLTEIAEDPKSRALELAIQLSKMPPVAASSSKTSLERAVFPNMEPILQDEVNVASYCFSQSDAGKAFTDFASRKSNKQVPHMNGDLNASASVVVDKVEDDIKRKSTVLASEPRAEPNLTSTKDLNTALEIAVRSYPTRTFIRFEGKDITFQEFDQSIAALAGGFKALGVQPGDRILVMMRNSVEMVHTWFATNRLGAIWVPINIELKSATLQHAARSAEAKVAIVDREFEDDLKSTAVFEPNWIFVNGGEGVQEFNSLYHQGQPVEKAEVINASTTSAFLYTSGTTGKSKPCVLSHQYFILQATALIEAYGLHGDDVLYCPFPLFHADATALTTVPAMLLGATAALSARFSASKFWDEIRSCQATVYDFMGATLALTYKQKPSDSDRDHKVRLAWGVPIPTFADDYEQRFGHPLYTLYGSVEASLPIMQQSRPLVPGSCGKVRPGYTARIVDDFGETVPANTTGHLLLRTDVPNAFFKGYFNDSDNTMAAFADLWFHTGDLAKIDDQGNVFFVGRVKDVIRRRGENINASEVEEEFLRHPDVIIAAAYPIPSTLGEGTEEDVKVAIKLRDGCAVDEQQLWEWSVQNMARFQVPSVIEIMPDLKRTPTGKLEKRSLSITGGKQFPNRPPKSP